MIWILFSPPKNIQRDDFALFIRKDTLMDRNLLTLKDIEE